MVGGGSAAALVCSPAGDARRRAAAQLTKNLVPTRSAILVLEATITTSAHPQRFRNPRERFLDQQWRPSGGHPWTIR
jgi:hypothetical protein